MREPDDGWPTRFWFDNPVGDHDRPGPRRDLRFAVDYVSGAIAAMRSPRPGHTPDGSRIPILWLREPDDGWPTRFWFDNPVRLPQGSRLETTTVLDPGATRLAKSSLLGGDTSAPIRFAVDYVSGAIAAN